MTTTGVRPIEILLVEDSPSDRLITESALQHARLLNTLHVVSDGVQAMQFLRREGPYAGAVQPDLILLDLNLPRMDGREVLAEVKADPVLRSIPIIVLTTSEAVEDVQRAYAFHANSYITKPVDFARFSEAVSTLGAYWFEVVTLPVPVGEAPEAWSGPGMRVLLVEDSATDALLLREALRTRVEDVHMDVAPRLSAARRLLGQRRYDVIITDLSLPDATDMDAVRALRLASVDVPVLVLTGRDDHSTGRRAMREGAVDYLVKGEATPAGVARAVAFAVERSRYKRELERSERLRVVGTLAAGVAHDFNNLLTVIQAGASLLADEEADLARDRPILDDVLLAAERGRALTRQLLNLTRRHAFDPEPTQPSVVLRQLLTMARRIAPPGVCVEVDAPEDLPLVHAEASHVEQALLNVVSNAVDALRGEGRITLVARTVSVELAEARERGVDPGEFVSIGVVDDGPGMPPHVLERAFDPFFTTKTEGTGTGLGMASAAEIARQHRGFMIASSEPTVRTEVAMVLPVTGASLQPVGDDTTVRRISSASASALDSATVLLVDDDTIVRSTMARVLRRSGYSVVEAADGAEALEVWRADPARVDVVVTDLVMDPGMGGRALGEELERLGCSVPVTFVSGYSSEFTGSELLRPGENFIQKPFDGAAFVDFVSRALARGAH